MGANALGASCVTSRSLFWITRPQYFNLIELTLVIRRRVDWTQCTVPKINTTMFKNLQVHQFLSVAVLRWNKPPVISNTSSKVANLCTTTSHLKQIKHINVAETDSSSKGTNRGHIVSDLVEDACNHQIQSGGLKIEECVCFH